MSDTFASLLRRYRREAGLSQEALAEEAALSKDAISTLERGSRRAPYHDTVELLARALRLDVARRGEFEAAAARGRAQRLHAARDGAHPSNLPQMGTTLVGRDADADALLERIEQHRIVTIVGPGGIGKTRLAVYVGERYVQAHRAGAWFADLAAVSRGATVVSKVAAALGVSTAGTGDPLREMATALRLREGLLILDNCEHVIDDAATAAAAIASAAPTLVVLATSRERLAVRGESVYHLGTLGKEEARELFRMRASSAGLTLMSVDQRAVDEVCSEVDNIPLAIELAAARAPLFGLSELHGRLRGQLSILAGGDRDAPGRQRTMHETIGWSYDLLDETERVLFRRLSVFAGGWRLDSLAPVALAPPIEGEALLPAFTSLVEKSLVGIDLETDPVRYRFLEPIRTFAAERLELAGEREAYRTRHAHWIADFASEVAPSQRDGRAPEPAGVARRELDNARAALDWSLQSDGDVVIGARIIGGMQLYWLTAGLLSECRRWCELILAQLDTEGNAVVAARVFRALIASLTAHQEEQASAVVRAIPVLEHAGDWSGVVALMSLLMVRSVEVGRLEEAQQIFDDLEAIRQARDLKPNSDWINVLTHRSYVLRLEKRFGEAAAVLDETISLARSLQHSFQEMWALLQAGEIAFALGDTQKAIAMQTEALAKNRSHSHIVIEIHARANLAGYYIAGGDFESARREAREAISRASHAEPEIIEATILHLATAAAVSVAPHEAARLKGYLDARYAGREYFLDPSEMASYATLTSALAAQLSAGEIRQLEREGALLDDSNAAELAATL